jgi:lipopolysaccharide export system permease protein
LILQLYVFRTVAVRILSAAIVLLALLQILDLLDVTTEILERNLGLAGVLHYAALRLPGMVEQIAPVSVLAGALFAFAKLARESAVVAMRASGLSAYRLTAMAAPAALLVILVHFAVSQYVTPRSEQSLETWWRATSSETDDTRAGPRTFRLGSDIVVASKGDERGRALTGVRIYRRAPDGQLTQRIAARAAVFTHGEWELLNPTMEYVGETGVRHGAAQQMVWPNPLRPSDILDLFSKQRDPSAAAALRALEGGGAERSPAYYKMQFQRAVAAPIGALVMLLLAAPVALANFRSGRGTQTIAASMAAGLLFMVIDGLFTAMGQSGAAPVILAAWAAPAAFGIMGATALIYLEG